MGFYKNEREFAQNAAGVRQYNPWLIDNPNAVKSKSVRHAEILPVSGGIFVAQPGLVPGITFAYGFKDSFTSINNVMTDVGGFAATPRHTAGATAPSDFYNAVGRDGGCWYFPNTDREYLDCPAATVALTKVQYNLPWSLSFWLKDMKPIGATGYEVIFSTSWSTTVNTISVIINTVGTLSARMLGNPTGTRYRDIAINYNIYKNSWQHVVITNDGLNVATSLILYINSFPVGVRTNSVVPISTPTIGAVVLGGYNNVNYYANAYYDQFVIWDKTLTPFEVDAIYNGGFGIVLNTATVIGEPANPPNYPNLDFFDDFHNNDNFTDASERPDHEGQVVERFSAPGELRTQRGYLDFESGSISPYNALPWRNLEPRKQLQAKFAQVETSSVPVSDEGYSWISNLTR